VVCELFGCTGWARKFRFEVLGENGKAKAEQITKGQTFKLRFTPLRPILPQEWALLDLTLRLIAEYGAIGGKTVLKPSDEQDRANKPHHRDYGLIQVIEGASSSPVTEAELRDYVTEHRWRQPQHDDFAWASLEHFWYVKDRYLTRTAAYRSSFNQFVGRDQRKTCVDCGSVHDPPQKCPKTKKQPRRHSDRDPFDAIGKWLAGSRGVSKKVFSFKEPGNARRTFGFVKPETVDFNEIKRRLKQVWPNLNDTDFRQGREILNSLFSSAGATP
jgi:CRISPR-associated protein Cmr1